MLHTVAFGMHFKLAITLLLSMQAKNYAKKGYVMINAQLLSTRTP